MLWDNIQIKNLMKGSLVVAGMKTQDYNLANYVEF